MKVIEATTRSQRRRFVDYPKEVYRGDARWAPPLWSDERGAYSARTNPILAHSDYALLLAEEDGRTLGRSLVYVDREFNGYYGTRIGMLGAFECTGDLSVAHAMDDAAIAWLAARGMNRVRGPINPVSECWGFLLEGFDDPPVFMAPYNPKRYNDFFAALGYTKAKDLLAYEGSPERGYRIPQRFSTFGERTLRSAPGLSVRPLDMKNLVRDADAILSISNIALKDNWGYVPIKRDEFQTMFRKLKMIVDPQAVWFVEDRGRPIGYALGFPDLNVILTRIGGRLLPFGFLQVLFGIRKVRDYRLYGLAVLPEYHGRGLDVLLYCELYRALAPRIRRIEANYILEDNLRIRNALEKLDLTLVKTYRVYEKTITPA
ncbi:MAG TPA: GNAT family N-acetyltransferase [Spirochaetia bacterium]